mgnify:CR=1 FL=1
MFNSVVLLPSLEKNSKSNFSTVTIAFLATKEMPAATAEGAVAENPEVFLKEIKKGKELFVKTTIQRLNKEIVKNK